MRVEVVKIFAMKRQIDRANFDVRCFSAVTFDVCQKSVLKSATLRRVTSYFSALKASIVFTREDQECDISSFFLITNFLLSIMYLLS